MLDAFNITVIGSVNINSSGLINNDVNLIKSQLLYILCIPVLHVAPVHPGLHSKQDPSCIRHVFVLQLPGHGALQLFPNTPSL